MMDRGGGQDHHRRRRRRLELRRRRRDQNTEWRWASGDRSENLSLPPARDRPAENIHQRPAVGPGLSEERPPQGRIRGLGGVQLP